MKEYLSFVWQSLTHPTQIMDVMPAVQLVLALICWYYCIRAFIAIAKEKYNSNSAL